MTVTSPRAANVANEATPLLGEENAVNGCVETQAPEEPEAAPEGMPDVAARMHLLFPAIGIGVSHFPTPLVNF